jgi:hypothetical protein
MLYWIDAGFFFFGNSPGSEIDAARAALHAGDRAHGYEVPSAVTFFPHKTDVQNANFPDALSKTPDIMVLARAHYSLARRPDPGGDLFATVRGSDDINMELDSVFETKTVTAAGLLGPHKEDFVADFTTLTAKRFWRLSLFHETAIKHKLSKIYLTRKFHPGREPHVDSRMNYAIRVNPGERKPVRTLELIYEAVHKTKYQYFRDRFVKHAAIAPVFLYADNDQSFLGYDRLFHGVITRFEIRARSHMTYSFSVNVQEMI